MCASRSVTPYSLIFTCILPCLGLYCHIDKFTVVAYLEKLHLFQALIKKELKFGVTFPPSL